MKLSELIETFSTGAPDISTDSSNMLRRLVRQRKKNIKWLTRQKKTVDDDDDKPDFEGDGEGDMSDETVDAGWRYDGG